MYNAIERQGKEPIVNAPLHLGKYHRYLFEDAGLMVVTGYFEEVRAGKKRYEDRHRIGAASADHERALTRLMAGAALAAVSLAERESWGWTLTLPGEAHGLFCGVEPEGMICGVVRPAEASKAAAYVQRQKRSEPMTQSFFEPISDDPVAAAAQYFEQVAQIDTRIALEGNDFGVLVQSTPGGRFEEVKDLPGGELCRRFRQMAGRGELKLLDEVVIFYECRCNDAMILEMVGDLPKASRDELWQDKSELEATCPRCGREYTLERRGWSAPEE
jgi:redox-regulated HSP33 family molecular chaperone